MTGGWKKTMHEDIKIIKKKEIARKEIPTSRQTLGHNWQNPDKDKNMDSNK